MTLVERDSDAFMDWLADCADEFGVEAMAADGLNTYKPVAKRLGLERQICMAHPLKWARRRLGKIAWSCCALSALFGTPRTRAFAARAWS